MVAVNITKQGKSVRLTNQENHVIEVTNYDSSDLLAGALAKCTSSTVEKFIKFKGYDITSFKLSVQLDRDSVTKTANFNVILDICGNVDEVGLRQIRKASKKSYIFRLLSNDLHLESQVIYNDNTINPNP